MYPFFEGVGDQFRRLSTKAVITCELAMRFMTDYLDGDAYFKTAYEGHNLVRARAQMKLLCEVEAKMDEMNAFVESLLS